MSLRPLGDLCATRAIPKLGGSVPQGVLSVARPGGRRHHRAWCTASRIAAAVTVAAIVPSTVSAQVAASPGAAGGQEPEARQKITSPSTGVKAGFTARAIPALAMRAAIAQPRLSSEASVHTHTSVVLAPARIDRFGGSGSSATTVRKARDGSRKHSRPINARAPLERHHFCWYPFFHVEPVCV